MAERIPGADDEEVPIFPGEIPRRRANGTVHPVVLDPGPKTAIGRAWKPLNPEFLSVAPPARRWLLRHPTHDGKDCLEGHGDGLLPLGKVGLLAAEGGSGKTNIAIALAIATVTGRYWLDYFHVDPQARYGRVLLLLGEEDEEEVHRRLYAVAQWYQLTAEERARVADQVVVLALAGSDVALMNLIDGRTLIESAELLELRARLTADAGQYGWSLVLPDPLSRFAAPDAEVSNAAATRFVQALETLTQVPGNPLALITHHTGAASRANGEQARARGVTSLTDSVRWVATLRIDAEAVCFRQTKSNYSRPMFDELRLVRGSSGMLRVPSEDENEEWQRGRDQHSDDRARARELRRETAIVAMMPVLLAALKAAQPGTITSREAACGLVSGDQNIKGPAWSRLIGAGAVARSNGIRSPYAPV